MRAVERSCSEQGVPLLVEDRRALSEVDSLGCPSVRECLLKSDAFRLTIGEVDGEEPVRAIETLELHLATLGEPDS